MSAWHIYQKDANQPHNAIEVEGRLPPPPAWRDFEQRAKSGTRGSTYKPSDDEVQMINTALYLRRPLLITGNPGSGKSSLAYSVAWQLGLGPVLWWPVNSRSTLQEGLYNYDALGRLRDLNIKKLEEAPKEKSEGGEKLGETPGGKSGGGEKLSAAERIGRYIRLGPLGTALYGDERPRVLLIDEVDKSDIDLPNDLLHVLEEGAFDIPELQRLTPDESNPAAERRDEPVDVWLHGDNKRTATLRGGRVECKRFPLIILTSNGERDMPPAFKRRCLNLNIADPEGTRLREIVAVHIAEAKAAPDGLKLLGEIETAVANFQNKRDEKHLLLATDQLLNAIYLTTRERKPEGKELEEILKVVLRELGKS
jgi:MoxR-like ATPase